MAFFKACLLVIGLLLVLMPMVLDILHASPMAYYFTALWLCVLAGIVLEQMVIHARDKPARRDHRPGSTSAR